MSSIIISDSNAMNSFTGQGMTFIDEINPVFLQFSDIGCSDLYIPDTGVVITILDPSGNLSDAFVFDSGPASHAGWTSEAISVPTNSVSDDEFIYVRGDGCNNLPDTDSADDWKYLWSISGLHNTLCLATDFSEGESIVTPIVGPVSYTHLTLPTTD